MFTQKRVHKCALAVLPLIVNTWKQLNVHPLMDFKHVVYIQWVATESVTRSIVSNSFETPWTIAHQAPLSMEFSRQELWCGLPFPSPKDLPNLDQTQVSRIWVIREAIQYNTMQFNGLFSHKKEILIHVKNTKDYAKWMHFLCGFYLHEMSRIISLQTETKKLGMGRFKISLGGIKCFASKQRILKATELYTLEWLKVNLCHEFCLNFLNF